MLKNVQVVWFKRDLRLSDHGPLTAAAKRGPVLPLYVIEPEIITAADFAPRHWNFIRQCLLELDRGLTQLGQPLVIRHGDIVAVLSQLFTEQPFTTLWAHQETSNWVGFQRDKQVIDWCRATGIQLNELPNCAVVRKLTSRDRWHAHWDHVMGQAQHPAPSNLTSITTVQLQAIPDAQALGIGSEQLRTPQQGGTNVGLHVLSSFLKHRAKHYPRGMGSPNNLRASARISPYLAWGALSGRQVVQQTRQQIPNFDLAGRKALRTFENRLHWREHFMQKIEDEPEIEFHNFARSMDGMRAESFNQSYFDAWANGQTGYPMVDACMRSLQATGWINFRMRAMLVSFTAYHLWLHWQKPALHLARLFVDYEPGIHYCQHQMQAGTTSINVPRIYDPVKQGLNHDAKGGFVRHWVPELRDVPTSFIHAPWHMPYEMQQRAGITIGKHYPAPIVDTKQALAFARAELSKWRNSDHYSQDTVRVLRKHASRRRSQHKKDAQRDHNPRQIGFDFDNL